MSDHDDDPVHRGRRQVLQSGLALAGGLWLPPAFAQSQGNFDWKRFKGEKIEIALQKSPFHDVLQCEVGQTRGVERGVQEIQPDAVDVSIPDTVTGRYRRIDPQRARRKELLIPQERDDAGLYQRRLPGSGRRVE